MRVGTRILFAFQVGVGADADSSLPGGLISGPLAHTRGSVLDAPGYQGRSPWLVTFRRKKEKLRGGWVQSANFASECARKLLIL